MSLDLPTDVVEWIQSLTLPSFVRLTKHELSNGYLFAEICASFWGDVDMASFENKHTKACREANWRRLRGSFAANNCVVAASLTEDVMQGSAGAAEQLLLKLHDTFAPPRQRRSSTPPQSAAKIGACTPVKPVSRGDPTGASLAASSGRANLRIVVGLLLVLVVAGMWTTIGNASAPSNWHGCDCLRTAPAEAQESLILRRLLSSRAQHHTARLMPLHVQTERSATDVAFWLQSTVGDLSGAYVHLVSTPLSSVEDLMQLLGTIRRHTEASCIMVVVPMAMAGRPAIEAFKEIAEFNTLRGEPVLRDGSQGIIALVTREGREWLLEQVSHRTVHVMATVPFVL